MTAPVVGTESIVCTFDSDACIAGVITETEVVADIGPVGIQGRVEQSYTITGTVGGGVSVSGGVGIGDLVQVAQYPYYEGEYSVVPSMDATVMPTRHTALVDDIVVGGVPAFRTSNPYGETFTIG